MTEADITPDAETLTITKQQLEDALFRSGVSYERPTELDAEDVWEELVSIVQGGSE